MLLSLAVFLSACSSGSESADAPPTPEAPAGSGHADTSSAQPPDEEGLLIERLEPRAPGEIVILERSDGFNLGVSFSLERFADGEWIDTVGWLGAVPADSDAEPFIVDLEEDLAFTDQEIGQAVKVRLPLDLVEGQYRICSNDSFPICGTIDATS